MQRKQARIMVCIIEPLLFYMNSECVLECRDTPHHTVEPGINLIHISIAIIYLSTDAQTWSGSLHKTTYNDCIVW